MKFLRIAAVAFLLAAVCFCAACTPYAGDTRLGTYLSTDGRYRLSLTEDGTGEITYFSAVDGETRERIYFSFDGDTLSLRGDAKSGGVVGRYDYDGTCTDGAFTLANRETGLPLADFVKED